MSKYTPQTEGVDHINAYSKSKTELGKFLSNWYEQPIEIRGYGVFASLENFWFYLKSEDDSFRMIKPYEAKQKAKILEINGDLTEAQQHIFKGAVNWKIGSNQDFIYKNYTGLPIVHYYVYGNKVIQAGPQWWVDHLNFIVKFNKDLMDKVKAHEQTKS